MSARVSDLPPQASNNVTAARRIVVLVRGSLRAPAGGRSSRLTRVLRARGRRGVCRVPIYRSACICTGQWRQKAIDGDGSVAAAPAVCCLTFEFKRREMDHASITKASKKKPFLLQREDLVDRRRVVQLGLRLSLDTYVRMYNNHVPG